MSELLLLLTLVTIIVLFLRIVVNAVRHKPIKKTGITLGIIVVAYTLLWLLFSVLSTDRIVPYGTDLCFDDWCASITATEKVASIGQGQDEVHAKGSFVILHVSMSNHAREIAQTPSEPRIHIIDGRGHSWSVSEAGQKALERSTGKQTDLAAHLELQQSLETQMVFDIPADAKEPKILIEEGPFITNLVLKEGRKLFPVGGSVPIK